MKSLKLILAACLVIAICSPAAAQNKSSTSKPTNFYPDENQSTTILQNPLVQHVKKRYLGKKRKIRYFTGHQTIERNQAIDESILVNDGDLTIAGKVDGKVVAINGNIHLLSTASLGDDVVSINGKIYRESGTELNGEMIETVIKSRTLFAIPSDFNPAPPEGIKNIEENDGFEDETEVRRRHYEWPKKSERKIWNRSYRINTKQTNLVQDEHIVYRYNRVEGLFLGANVPPARKLNSNFVDLDVNGYFGYGFATKKWRFEGNAELWLFGRSGPSLGTTVYNLTDTRDEWIIPTEENSLAAFLIREDFQDYFQREGHGFYIQEHFTSKFVAQFGYFEDKYASLEKNTNWSIFGGEKRFRFNPEIDAGRLKSYKAQVTLDTRDDLQSPFSGWYISGRGLWSRDGMATNFNYNRFIIDIRRYIPLRYGENFDIRLRAGSGNGVLPRQDLFYLGGLSSLRGFEYKNFAGNRMVLTNIEYRVGNNSRRFRNNWLLDSMNLIFFFDSGLAWFADSKKNYNEGFDQLTWNKLHSNIGIALTDDEGRVRLNFAKSVDAGPSDVIVTFRINRAF